MTKEKKYVLFYLKIDLNSVDYLFYCIVNLNWTWFSTFLFKIFISNLKGAYKMLYSKCLNVLFERKTTSKKITDFDHLFSDDTFCLSKFGHI